MTGRDSRRLQTGGMQGPSTRAPNIPQAAYFNPVHPVHGMPFQKTITLSWFAAVPLRPLRAPPVVVEGPPVGHGLAAAPVHRLILRKAALPHGGGGQGRGRLEEGTREGEGAMEGRGA